MKQGKCDLEQVVNILFKFWEVLIFWLSKLNILFFFLAG